MTRNEKSTKYKTDANLKKKRVSWQAAVRGLSTALTPWLFISRLIQSPLDLRNIKRHREKKSSLATNPALNQCQSYARLTHGGAPVSAQLGDKAPI